MLQQSKQQPQTQGNQAQAGLAGEVAPPDRLRYRIAKNVFDWCMALVGLAVISPIMLLIALLVRLTSRGPVIYRQVRVGINNRPFEIYKFRTMRVDAEKSGARWATRNDPRVTPLGGLLRRTHLDELPQLINVLKG